VSAYGHRQHTSKDAKGEPPVTVPPIRDEHAFAEHGPEQALDAFDSEASLELFDGSARVERTSDLNLFPSEQLDVDDVVADDAPATVLALPSAGAVDQQEVVFSTEQQAAAVVAERLAVVTTLPERAPLFTTRRLAVVAGICGCLGLTISGMLIWRTPAPVAAPSPIADGAALPSAARAALQEPVPALLPTPIAEAPSTLEPSTAPDRATQPGPATRAEQEIQPDPIQPAPIQPEPRVPPAPAAAGRDPIATPAAPAVVLPPGPGATADPARLTRDASRDMSETTAAAVSNENTRIPARSDQANLNEPRSPAADPVSAIITPSVSASAAPLPPPPPMRPPVAPASARAIPNAAGATAATPVPARDATDIELVLTQYRSGFSDLDAAAVSKVWPNVDSRALARAFRGLEAQGIAFDSCVIQVTGASAAASCGGTVRYVTKVGSKEPRTEDRRWQFTLAKVRDLWMIQTVESR
jgi:hypothetical protein